MYLLLFDIDGTLIEISGLGRAMLGQALRVVYGTSGPIESYRFAGKTDRRMARDLMAAAGVSGDQFEAGLPALYRAMEAEGGRLFRPGALVPCSGVVQLLAALATRSDVTLGLLTGNIQATAHLKLRAAGLDPALFVAGAYGSDSDDRNDLTFLAQRRAASQAGQTFDGCRTIVLGDTPADIACARVAGAQSVAVGTGSGSAKALLACAPDFWFDNLADTVEVVATLLPPAVRQARHQVDGGNGFMDEETRAALGITFNEDGPTRLTMHQLRHWVIWQFPRPKGKGLSGAVRPSIAGHGWYPAIVEASKKRVWVYANIAEPCDSPEKAVKKLETLVE